MFVRLLFLLLLALNLGVGGWLLFGHTPPPPATDPGVPALRLLSEVTSTSSGASPSGPHAQATVPQAGERCFSLGPFATEADMRAALGALSPRVARIQYRKEQTTASRGWWVYLPALPSREQALTTARALADQGVRDYYVVTAGDNENTISLGLFHDAANARRRQQQIAALGVHPALTERIEQVPVWYVDYALARGQQLAWQSVVPDPAAQLGATPMACF
ncbi:MAG TPA: SPOR domain-containing protein [Rhodanobacteraceae bacterium]|nr:SPOR domain-containing protein [Rhodanobacteraceae bacterium]